MASRNTNLYRAKALERFASPDNLERLVPAVHRRDWMPVLVTGVLFGLALFWAFAGSVPTVVSGRGVLLKPRRVVRVQSLGGGRLLALTVRAGDEVQTGQIIGKLDQSEIRKRIEEDRATVATLTGQDHVKTASDQQRLQLQLCRRWNIWNTRSLYCLSIPIPLSSTRNRHLPLLFSAARRIRGGRSPRNFSALPIRF